MPLPSSSNAVWPPVDLRPMYDKMGEWAAWYSGDPSRLIDAYAGSLASNRSSSDTVAIPWYRFWSRSRAFQDGAQRAQLHVPIASDLASVSGALLFGEPCRVRVRPDDEKAIDEAAAEAKAQAEVKPPEPKPFDPMAPPPPPEKKDPVGDAAQATAKLAKTPEQKAERRILKIIEDGDVNARLGEAAESAAAMGGVYIYPAWDKDLRDFPLLMVAQADNAVPTFRLGMLSSVTFWRVVGRDGNVVWRHLECHEVEGTGDTKKAVVLHGLYRGGTQDIGAAQSLGAHPETANLEPRVELPFAELDVEYIPNIRPNRLYRSSSLGVADIQGSESLLDGLDEVYASWIRDVRLAKARIIVPREYLRMDEDGHSAFDIDQEVYVPMEMEPGLSQDSRAMLAHQFQIRYLEHRETARAFIERIVSGAGYTPQTLGSMNSDGSSSGTALRVSEHKTLLTLRRKTGWWNAAVANVLHRMMIIDKEIFGSGIEPIKPTVTLNDAIIDNPLELAQTALALKTAESASIETRVKILHDDWSEAEVQAEVARIKGDVEAAKPPVPAFGGGGSGAFGNPKADPASMGNIPTTKQPTGPAPKNAPPPQTPKA